MYALHLQLNSLFLLPFSSLTLYLISLLAFSASLISDHRISGDIFDRLKCEFHPQKMLVHKLRNSFGSHFNSGRNINLVLEFLEKKCLQMGEKEFSNALLLEDSGSSLRTIVGSICNFPMDQCVALLLNHLGNTVFKPKKLVPENEKKLDRESLCDVNPISKWTSKNLNKHEKNKARRHVITPAFSRFKPKVIFKHNVQNQDHSKDEKTDRFKKDANSGQQSRATIDPFAINKPRIRFDQKSSTKFSKNKRVSQDFQTKMQLSISMPSNVKPKVLKPNSNSDRGKENLKILDDGSVCGSSGPAVNTSKVCCRSKRLSHSFLSNKFSPKKKNLAKSVDGNFKRHKIDEDFSVICKAQDVITFKAYLKLTGKLIESSWNQLSCIIFSTVKTCIDFMWKVLMRFQSMAYRFFLKTYRIIIVTSAMIYVYHILMNYVLN